MLDRLFGRRPPVALRFERRECVIVPQTPSRIALHADVHFAAIARPGREAVIEDAHLVWRVAMGDKAVLRRSRWDRAVVEGRFRYPPQPLAVRVSTEALPVTLTFTDPLIPHGPEPPPEISVLTIELSLAGGRAVSRDLWRVRMASWDETAFDWVGGADRLLAG